MPGPSRGIHPIMAGCLFILAQFSNQMGEKATRQNRFGEVNQLVFAGCE
jgi:hypothetical protein